MPQSLCYLLVHIIYSTKGRHPLISDKIAPGLHAYLATIARDTGCECYRVGGVADHVHLAVRVKSDRDVAKLIKNLKAHSTRMLKQTHPELSRFAWQRGYGAFSVSPHFRENLIAYIDNQKEHHKTESFQEEFRRFLKKYDIPYDERYVWD